MPIRHALQHELPLHTSRCIFCIFDRSGWIEGGEEVRHVSREIIIASHHPLANHLLSFLPHRFPATATDNLLILPYSG